MAEFTFFEDQATNATSDPYSVRDGGYRIIKVTGDFDGANLDIEVDFNDDEWAPILAYTWTEADTKECQPLKTGLRLRAVITNAGAGTDITAKVL